MNKIKSFLCLFIFCYSALSVQGQKRSISSPTVPNGLGVNIHFTDPKLGEMEMLSEAGFKWVRMDLLWANIEKKKGVYDFSSYDRLVASLKKFHIRAIFILDYGNPMYDKGMAPQSPEAIGAFAKWAAASAKHFAGNGFLWEMWNEPNIFFWKPKPDVNAYIRLALATGKAIKKATPQEAFIGPATSEIPLHFLEACFKAGLLQYWDAVSLHPYRRTDPETVKTDYDDVRQLIEKYAPAKKSIPIISSEWGYSAALPNFDAEKQGIMLAREFLINLSCKIPVSIWYDWHNDGENSKDTEHNFGTVAYAYHSGRKPVYDPKPAYLAAETLMHVLKGFYFENRLLTSNKDDYILVFKKGRKYSYAVWTTDKPHTILFPTKIKRIKSLDYKGNESEALKRDGKEVEISLSNAPQYLVQKN